MGFLINLTCMNSKTLHVLNGDATMNVFKETEISGDILIWREILSEGPVTKNSLFQLRSKWIYETFGENYDSYKEKVINEVNKLNSLTEYDQIILWFEYDLVCQINLIFVLATLKNINYEIPIYLICPDKFDGLPNFRGLGELSPTQLKKLLPTKIKLSLVDLDLAAKAWDLYIENDSTRITTFLKGDFGKLALLKKALAAHLMRSEKSNGLNHIHEVLLGFINAGMTNKSEIYEKFWAQESIFGLGDLQLDLALNEIQKKGFISKDFAFT
ncbi:DUF1835 domain-containing protein [Pedobacter polaris]|uniref:DUF1835 domain-containing protein n=1 Tax=Pedobacter polaris TaxID=2571273 RepID=A0A4U1CUW9_9SPHI|nr:DUF1835 domain-containing protein [Pedobacter polaris]TKC12436.1 DUF1835 domain-containing protein [Pedobacter polaris]